MNLNQVTMPAIDVQVSIDFYRRMGFTLIVNASPRYARFECPAGDSTFSLHRIDEEPKQSGFIVYFECEDLDRKVEELTKSEFNFEQLPTDEPWLWREARLKDPAGSVICLFSADKNRKYPPWRKD